MAIRFENVHAGFAGRRAVGPLDIHIRSGTTVVILGRSGSGKTTTLRMVNALLFPDQGSVSVLGRPTRNWDVVRLRRSVGYVIQEVGLFPHMTVAQNVGVVPRLEGWSAASIGKRTAELLELVELDPQLYASRYPSQLSGGQRQRVGVARALAADPEILLCDEPFGAVDPITRAELQRQFASLAGRLGKTVLFVTHDVREAMLLADRILLMDRGRVAFEGTPGEFGDSKDEFVRAFRGLVRQ